MKFSLKYLVIIAAMLGGVGLFYAKTQHIVASEHERFERSLSEIMRLDSVFNEDVLKAHYRLLEDYDSFGEQVDKIKELLNNLNAVPGFVDEAGRQAIIGKIKALSDLLAEKSELLETFKSQNAVLKNSLRYFPLAGGELHNRLSAAGDHAELETPFDELMHQVMAYNVAPSSALEQERGILATLARIDAWLAAHPNDIDSALVASLSAHARAILNRQPKVDALVRQLIAAPTTERVEEIEQIYDRQFAAAVQSAERYRGILYALCVVLFAGIGYTIYALHAANAHLERRARESIQAEEQIRASLNEVNNLKSALDEHAIVAITNPQGKIIYVNDKFCAISKYSREELLGQDHRVINSGYHPKAFIRGLWACIGRGNVWKAEMCNRAKDGALYWVDTTIVPFLDVHGKPVQYVVIRADITERKRAAANLEKMHKELVETSRQAGMAEVATGVLHNVGNVLNSVNVASSCLADSLRTSKAINLTKVVELIREHEKDLGAFFTTNPKGMQLPGYLELLAKNLASEQTEALKELSQLQKNIEHIKEIVSMQQSYARVSGVKETVDISELVEDSLNMNFEGLTRHCVEVIREFEHVPPLNAEKHKILQILVNLVQNAKHACNQSERPDKRLTVRVCNGYGRIKISIADNGIGIAPENLTRVFSHGFTTRKDGHGYGLHSGALAAKEMGGSLTVHSDGPGHGASFTLELPLQSPGTVVVKEAA